MFTLYFEKSTLLKKLYFFWINYFSPGNFSYLWNFGSLAFVCLIIQIITGVFLAMHYKSDINLAFSSIEYILRNVQYGWFLRYCHSNGASLFFLIVYLHIARGLLYGSFAYPRQLLWGTGIIIFVLMIFTAFMGYILPWGQMSYWACTVIISLFTAIPLIGNDIIYFIWGGYSVDDATLNRFFSLHFFFPFIIFFITVIHLMLLHEYGSNNPLGLNFKPDGFSMLPNYIVKDGNGMNIGFFFLILLIFFFPNDLGHPDNYILSNILVTPSHIVPEWYFLPFYAILRSVPDKLFGLILFISAILVLLCIPYLVGRYGSIRSVSFKPMWKILVPIFLFNYYLLGWLGGQPVVEPYYSMGQVATFFYFFLLISLNFTNKIETILLVTKN